MNETVQNIKNTMTPSQIIFWSLIVAIVMFSGTYMYFVQKTVWNAVSREKIQNDIVAINSKLSETEFKYINTVGSITMDTAKELGFQSATDKVTFVTRERIGKDVAIR